MENTRKWKIGQIQACIGGDHRYASRVEVHLTYPMVNGSTQSATKAEVIRLERVPSGGMDSFNNGSFEVKHRIEVDVDPKKIVKAIKDSFDETLERYSKPTKDFHWMGGEVVGLNVKTCASVLDGMKLDDEEA